MSANNTMILHNVATLFTYVISNEWLNWQNILPYIAGNFDGFDA